MRRLIISIILTLLLTVWAKGLYFTGDGFDWKLFVIIITLSYMICYKLVQYLAQFKIVENNSRIDIVFVVCIIAFMFVPILRIDRGQISVQENRTLAEYKPLIKDGLVNYSFGKDFENWFNDRFFGRKFFIDTNSAVNWFINKKLKNQRAMAGKDNWLFTKRWNSVEMFQNKYLYSDDELQEIKKNIEGLQAWLAKRNTRFYIMLVPDKERVYGEFYPKGFEKVNKQAKIEQLYAFIRQHTTVPVIYVYDALMEAKKQHIVYYKTGTHWNHRGAYAGYKALFGRLKKDFPSLHIMTEDEFDIVPKLEADVDIASALDIDAYKIFPKEDMTYDVFRVKNPRAEGKHTYLEKEKKIETFDYMSSDPAKKLKAVFYADSMFLRMNWYVAESFKQMQHIYVGYGRDYDLPFMGQDIRDIAPDIFVLETGERFLDRLLKIEVPEVE